MIKYVVNVQGLPVYIGKREYISEDWCRFRDEKGLEYSKMGRFTRHFDTYEEAKEFAIEIIDKKTSDLKADILDLEKVKGIILGEDDDLKRNTAIYEAMEERRNSGRHSGSDRWKVGV